MRAQSWTHALALRVLTPTHQGTDPAKDLSIQRLPLRCPLLPVGNGSHWGEGGGAQILLKSDLAGAYTKWTSQPTCARHFTIPTRCPVRCLRASVLLKGHLESKEELGCLLDS